MVWGKRGKGHIREESCVIGAVSSRAEPPCQMIRKGASSPFLACAKMEPDLLFPFGPPPTVHCGDRELITWGRQAGGVSRPLPEAGALGFTKEKKPKGGGLYIPDEAFVDMGNGLRCEDVVGSRPPALAADFSRNASALHGGASFLEQTAIASVISLPLFHRPFRLPFSG